MRRNARRSDIYKTLYNVTKILTLLSADVKSAIILRVLSLTKVEVRKFLLLLFSSRFCLGNGQLAISLQCMKWSVIFKF